MAKEPGIKPVSSTVNNIRERARQPEGSGLPVKQVGNQAMRNNKGQFLPGQSGNVAGRPLKKLALIDVLLKSLDRKKGGRQYKQLLCDKLVDLAVNAIDEADQLRAADKIFNILQRNHEFEIKTDIESRLDELEKRLNEAEHAAD